MAHKTQQLGCGYCIIETVNPSDLVLVWRITEVCDLACPFCAYSRDLRRPRAAANPDDVLRFGALLGEYARAYRRNILVSWLGGEPLLWKPLLDLSHTFKHAFGLRVSVTTNGTALDSEPVRRRIVEAIVMDGHAILITPP